MYPVAFSLCINPNSNPIPIVRTTCAQVHSGMYRGAKSIIEHCHMGTALDKLVDCGEWYEGWTSDLGPLIAIYHGYDIHCLLVSVKAAM